MKGVAGIEGLRIMEGLTDIIERLSYREVEGVARVR